jgi:hypothetical protein
VRAEGERQVASEDPPPAGRRRSRSPRATHRRKSE